jgi:hypothetical protein
MLSSVLFSRCEHHALTSMKHLRFHALAVEDRGFEIEFLDIGVQAFSITVKENGLD